MTITLLGIVVIMFLLLILFVINFIMSMFNSILFRVLKILLPISLITTLFYHICDYVLIRTGVLITPFTTTVVDVSSGVLTLIYTVFIIRRKTTGVFTKVLSIMMLAPMILYLLNTPVEYVSLSLFDFSLNSHVNNLLCSYVVPHYLSKGYTMLQTVTYDSVVEGIRSYTTVYITYNTTFLSTLWYDVSTSDIWQLGVDGVGLVLSKIQHSGLHNI